MAGDEKRVGAVKRDEPEQWWAEMNAYGRARARELGLTEAVVISAITEVRRERAAAKDASGEDRAETL